MHISHSHGHSTYQLKDYEKPKFLIDLIALAFDLHPLQTRVHSKMHIRRAKGTRKTDVLCLNGEALELVQIRLNGHVLDTNQYQLTDKTLTIEQVPDQFELEIEVIIAPEKNKTLSGLYISNGNYCTQCEPHGFRRITYYMDRPDIMTQYKVTITADKKRYPILLSNGDLIEQKNLPDGKHCVTWQDPSKKSCHLFALVAGDFDELKDQFKTCSGKVVDLFLYVEKGYADQAEYALTSLKHAMQWDEETFGREYDLHRYTIVAVSDFNAGAMENKALNIFNTKYVLAKPDTATDDDYVSIEDVIGHEYFHNWTGNRITCRDWCQLTLKEGLTVLRDQLFTEDRTTKLLGRMRSAKIILDRQFLEDTGPIAHAIRPDHYMSVDNLYTTTVYYKGAEVIRMLRTLLGVDGFRKGMDRYFKHYDEQAVTTDDFISALGEANHRDLTQFKRWYTQRGTPVVYVTDHYDMHTQQYTLTIKQMPPEVCGKPLKDLKPFHFPITMGLLDSSGKALDLNIAELHLNDQKTCTLEVTQSKHQFVFTQVPTRPVPSLLRHFSAPIKLHYHYSNEQLALLVQHDTDQFNRWLVSRQLIRNIILSLMQATSGVKEMLDKQSALLIDVFRALLQDQALDYYLLSQILTFPSTAYIIQSADHLIDPQQMVETYLALKKHLGIKLKNDFLNRYQALNKHESYVFNTQAMSARALKNVCLDYVLVSQETHDYALAVKQWKQADNMTDSLAALQALNHHPCTEREEVMENFYQRWKNEPLVFNKWLTIQASSFLPNLLERVEQWIKLPEFSLKNPNNVYALILTYALNPLGFHDKAGKGYEFLMRQILYIDQYNPQLAGRITAPLTDWRKYDTNTQMKMKRALENILNAPKLSSNVYELVNKALS